jgi:hypothetical protein
VFGDGADLPAQQLWLFWVAPIVGAIIGAIIYRVLIDSNDDVEETVDPTQHARELAAERIEQQRAAGNRAPGRSRDHIAS